jgi:hypothetical protein
MAYKNVQIDIYNNIFDAKSKLQNWAGAADFPPEMLAESIPSGELVTLLITFPGVFGATETAADGAGRPNPALKRYDLFIRRFLDTLLAPTFLVLTEPGKQLGNKIRTNKGWLPARIKTLSTSLEVEVPLQDSYTIFVSIIKLMERNKELLLAEYAHNSTACVIVDYKNQGTDLFNKEFMGSFPEKYMTGHAINFLQLATDLYPEEKAVYCFGGAAGQELSCKIFCHQQLKDRLVQQAEQALERNYSIEEI